MVGFEPHDHRHHQVVRSLLPTGCRLFITVWTTTNPFCSLLMQGSLLSSSSSRLFNSPFLSFCLIFCCFCCSSIPQTKVKLTSRRKKWNFCSSSSFRKRSSRARGLSRVEARTRSSSCSKVFDGTDGIDENLDQKSWLNSSDFEKKWRKKISNFVEKVQVISFLIWWTNSLDSEICNFLLFSCCC